jgi:F-type H+-transporting ATPase subunit b
VRQLLFKRIGGVLDDRAQAVKADIDAGKKSRAEGEELVRKYEAELRTAREECGALVEDARLRARGEYEKIIADAKLEAAGIIETARERTAAEREAAFRKVGEEFAGLVIEAATKVVEANMDTARNRTLIGEFLNGRETV